MKVCIILNGEIQNYKFIKTIIDKEKYDYIICADGGANHTYNMGITPNYIIGDLDSLKTDLISYYKRNGVKFEEFPSKKNETDAEICIYLARKLKAKQIDFLGALGGRVDHTLANIYLLNYVKEMDIIPRIFSENEEIHIAIDEEIIIEGKAGDTISVIPIKGDAEGVTLKNLEYPLTDYHMKYSIPLGISNVMKGDCCKIRVKHGALLVIKNI